ncbi:MAG: hypothetical protein LBK50_01895 [Candidatus Nomurabacteria bacterium]|jgi:hypothetical protein|nr:hypothetical protein [Candidatus Nomurabacteria bacterium]
MNTANTNLFNSGPSIIEIVLTVVLYVMVAVWILCVIMTAVKIIRNKDKLLKGKVLSIILSSVLFALGWFWLRLFLTYQDPMGISIGEPAPVTFVTVIIGIFLFTLKYIAPLFVIFIAFKMLLSLRRDKSVMTGPNAESKNSEERKDAKIL